MTAFIGTRDEHVMPCVAKNYTDWYKKGSWNPYNMLTGQHQLCQCGRKTESVRVRGNLKLTVNKVARLDRYPIPRIEYLLAKLAGGKRFSKLDMSQAYQQLLLDESSRQYVVINTHKGLFGYSRLPFGVSSAPGIFQRVMKNLLQINSLPTVAYYA